MIVMYFFAFLLTDIFKSLVYYDRLFISNLISLIINPPPSFIFLDLILTNSKLEVMLFNLKFKKQI